VKCFEKIFENSNSVLKTLVFKWNTFGVSTLAKWLREAHSEVDLHSRELSGGHQEGAPEVKVKASNELASVLSVCTQRSFPLVHRTVHKRESSEGRRGVKGPLEMFGEPDGEVTRVLEQCYYLLKFVRDHVTFRCSTKAMHRIDYNQLTAPGSER